MTQNWSSMDVYRRPQCFCCTRRSPALMFPISPRIEPTQCARFRTYRQAWCRWISAIVRYILLVGVSLAGVEERINGGWELKVEV